jgi:ubiquinone/menaquinone biosynthesis C-methylase UbiE
MTLLQVECLNKIYQLYISSEKSIHPSALDIASGEGVMTGCMMIAGAQVLAVDQNKKAIDNARKKILEMKKFLPQNKKEGRGKVSHYNALQFSKTIYPEDHNDIVWCSNLLQFVDKDQMPDFIKNMFHTTKPGGTVYIQTEAPTGQKLYDTYRENQEKGMPFPGFGIYNVQGIYTDKGSIKGNLHQLTATSAAQMVLVSHDSQGIAPGNRKAGFYGKDLEGPKKAKPNMSQPGIALYACEDSKYVGRYHVVYHLLDIEVLSNILKNAGFLIQDAYYCDRTIKFNEISKFFERENPDTTVLTCIVAQKPL